MAYQSIRGSGSGLQFLNFPFGDTTYTKVFVGGLAWETQSETLRRHFAQFGEILEAVVITDKHTGRSKGYGFVTFHDAEAAKRACANPSPVIDGRRANCNLASLGRPQPSLPHGGNLRSAPAYFGSPQATRTAYISPSYHPSMSFTYQPGIGYPPFGYSAYGPEYVYSQGALNPYLAHHNLQMYGVPGTINPSMLLYGQMGQPSPARHGYASLQGFMMPGHNILQYGGPHVNGATTETIPKIQAPYHTGIAAPAPRQAQSVLPSHPSELAQSNHSGQMAG